jgi:hypothetical protein
MERLNVKNVQAVIMGYQAYSHVFRAQILY